MSSTAVFTGFIVDVTLIVIEVSSGEIEIGQVLSGGGVADGTIISSFGSGNGGVGSYGVSIAQTIVGSETITGSAPVPPGEPDTGPPYPPPPGEESTGLGIYRIGVDQLGDVRPFYWWRTMISEYANSPTITQIIQDIDDWIDPTQKLEEFYDNVMNIDSAIGYGLDVWGRILGVQRTLTIVVGGWFGFAEALPGSVGFNQGAFFSGQPVTDNFKLVDDTYRTLLFAKAASNITNGSIPAINQILMNLFAHRGNAYVTEGTPDIFYFGFAEAGNAQGFNQAPFYDGEVLEQMVMAYNFNFALSPSELAIVKTSGVLPKPTGVKARTVVLGQVQ